MNERKKMKNIIFLLIILLVVSHYACIAGGGFLGHSPHNIKMNETNQIKLELGVNAGNAKAYSKVTLHYKLENEKNFIDVNMEKISQSDAIVVFASQIPAFGKDFIEKKFVYYFSFFMDNTENTYPEKGNYIVVEIVN